jgi:hypothetical protein
MAFRAIGGAWGNPSTSDISDKNLFHFRCLCEFTAALSDFRLSMRTRFLAEVGFFRTLEEQKV